MDKILTLCCLLLLLITPAYAAEQNTQDESPDEVNQLVCDDEQTLLTELHKQLLALREQARMMEAFGSGELPPEFRESDLETLLTDNTGTLTRQLDTLPESLSCKALTDDYTNTMSTLRLEARHLAKRRDAYWGARSELTRKRLLLTWELREQLKNHYRYLNDSLTEQQAVELKPLLRQVHEPLKITRLAFIRLVGSLNPDMDGVEVAAWLRLWTDTLDQPSLGNDDLAGLPEDLPDSTRRILWTHLQLLELDRRNLSHSINLIRAQLWQLQRPAFNEARTELQLDNTELLQYEGRAIINLLQWLYLDTIVEFRLSSEEEHSILQQVLQAFEYLLGVLAIWVLYVVARKLRDPALALQGFYARRFRSSRIHVQISRITSAIPVLLPLIVGWVGLSLLEAVFVDYNKAMLVPLIPLARLLIIYALLRLIGEWFLHSIAHQGGTFLNDQQLKQIGKRARQAAAIVILPWLVRDLLTVSIRQSLTLTMIDWLTLLALLLGLGWLLKPWRREYILTLQTIFPPLLDRITEKLLAGPGFIVLAPLFAPFALLPVCIDFARRALIDFDWYRRLSARGFLLRASPQEAEENTVPESVELPDYRCWFGEFASGREIPLINNSALEDAKKELAPWLEHHSEENSLLLSGERGSGKTTLLQRLGEWLQEGEHAVEVRQITIPPKTLSAAALNQLVEEALAVDLEPGPSALVRTDEDRTPTVVMFDDAQNLFLRQVGGFAAWETLLSLCNARLKNVFWVISINSQSWAYLRRVFGQDSLFGALLRLRPWSQNEIRSLILSRNRKTERRLQYDSILLSTRGPQAGNVRNAEQLYFNLLWDACKGNPLQAQHLWLTSISIKYKTVTVSLPEEKALSVLDKLADEFHFVYAALVLHENMTSEELVSATTQPERTVRSALKSALDNGLVQRLQNGRYHIVPLWYLPMIRFLARKNLLNE